MTNRSRQFEKGGYVFSELDSTNSKDVSMGQLRPLKRDNKPQISYVSRVNVQAKQIINNFQGFKVPGADPCTLTALCNCWHAAELNSASV